MRVQTADFSRIHRRRELSVTASCWLKTSSGLKSPPAQSTPIREHKPKYNPAYQWQEDVEDLEVYHEGRYHQVHIQDELSNGRYQVVHKLGFGSYSTVWLAKDLHTNRYVAIKIVVARASRNSREGQIFRHLRDTPNNHPGRSYASSISDEFYIDGPNGCHLCLVSEPTRCSIVDSKEASTNWMFPMRIARAVAA